MKKNKNQLTEVLHTPLTSAQTATVAVTALLLIAGLGGGVASNLQNSISSVAPAYTTAGLLNAKKVPAEKTNVWADLQAKGLQGEHYTLNIHGKGETFGKSDCTANSDGTLGNNIFIPSNGDSSQNNQIIMQSGNAKGKWAETNTTYGVLDSCTATFDGDAAELTLPSNSKGYYVVARVLGKPTNDPSLEIEGELAWVQDELGNDLMVLGLVTDDGFQTPDTKLTRTKGKVKAVDITGLFEWNGSVCYFDTTNYCYDETETYTCTDVQKCCTDTDTDGIYDTCVEPSLLDTTLYCDPGYQLMTLGCQDYTNEWVFNIGDFVGYMWNTTGSGDFKLANIRFYPVQ